MTYECPSCGENDWIIGMMDENGFEGRCKHCGTLYSSDLHGHFERIRFNPARRLI
jgi:uncharacterized Zn finger protein